MNDQKLVTQGETPQDDGEAKPALQDPSKPREQRPFTAYPKKDGTRRYWVDGFTKMLIKTKSGKEVINRRVQETWPDETSANARRDEINNLVMGRRVVPNKATNLSEEQILAAEEFFLAQHRTVAHLNSVIEMFKRLDGVKHPDWKPEALVDHAVLTAYGGNAEIPMFSAALDAFLVHKSKGDESHAAISEDTERGYAWLASLLKAHFSEYRADQWIDEVILEWIDSTEDVYRINKAGERVLSNVKKAWVNHEKDSGERIQVAKPWEVTSRNAIRIQCATIRNWFGDQGWGSRSKIRPVKLGAKDFARIDKVNRALTTGEKRTILNNAYEVDDGVSAAFFVQQLLGGCRGADTKRFDPDDYVEDDGKFSLNRAETKPRKSRVAQCMPIYMVLVADLKARGLFEEQNLNPTQYQRDKVLAMSGFEYVYQAMKPFKKYMIPGNKFPNNGLRRSAISAHFQVTENSKVTAEWAGTSRMMWEIWYERDYSKAQARAHWTGLLPRRLAKNYKKKDLRMLLPKEHKLNNTISQGLKELLQRTKVFSSKIPGPTAEQISARNAYRERNRATRAERASWSSEQRAAARKESKRLSASRSYYRRTPEQRAVRSKAYRQKVKSKIGSTAQTA